MTLDDIDATLCRLRAAADSIGGNLLELERDPSRKLLETATLTGETAARWGDASRALANIWVWFTRFTDLLERAAAARGPRARISADREADLVAMLTGPSIELTSEEIPLGDRDLTGDRHVTTRCTPDELLTTMSANFEQALTVVVAAGAAWDELVPRLRQARTALVEIDAAAAGLGEEADAELDGVRRHLDRLGAAVAGDPMSTDAADFDVLEAELAGLHATLDGATQLRDELLERVTRARSAMDELRRATHDAAEAHHEVLVKIAVAPVPIPPTFDRAIGAQLDAVIELTERGEWRAAQSSLGEWTTRVGELLRRAHEAAAANRVPIESRNELRGRLDAYHAMAHRIGLLEDAHANEVYERAHNALYTAPTDLAEGAELVRAYQDVLSRRATKREELR